MKFLLYAPPKYKKTIAVSVDMDRDGVACFFCNRKLLYRLESARVTCISEDVMQIEGFEQKGSGTYLHHTWFLREAKEQPHEQNATKGA